MSISKYMIGQRVVYGGVICLICAPEDKHSSNIWVDNPERGYKHGVARSNIEPLPNGQL